MKIGFDFINLRNLHEGLGRYAWQLINGLAAIDRENEYILFVNVEISNQICVDNPRFHTRVVNIPRRRYAPWNQIYFGLHRRQLRGIDLLHSPVSPTPLLLFGTTKTVVTLHDLAWKLFPGTFGHLGVVWWRIAWPRSLKQSEHIVTDSESTKRDIIKFYRIPEEKITVIYPYISLHLPQTSSEALDTIKKRYNLPEKYILHVGVPHKRKNLESLVKAFQIVKKEKDIPHKLVLVGPKGWAIESLLSEIARLNMQDEVIVTGFTPDNDLSLIYRAADAFVYPSLYEGFGYPPLEAMACGTPVIVSNISSLPEVVGDAGLYIDPLNPEDIAAKILQLLSSPDLADKLRLLGLKRVQQFSMEKMINKYLEIYQKVCEHDK